MSHGARFASSLRIRGNNKLARDTVKAMFGRRGAGETRPAFPFGLGFLPGWPVNMCRSAGSRHYELEKMAFLSSSLERHIYFMLEKWNWKI